MYKKAILLGASGLTGGILLEKLLNHPAYTSVLILTRQLLHIEHPKLKQVVVDFDRPDSYAAELHGDMVFCCLGTTKKKTPDLTQYHKIDFQYPLDIANLSFENGVSGFHLLSALGANLNSSVFYSKTKGEIEAALQAIPFHNLHIYRPSLLVGNRKEQRFGEKLMIGAMQLFNPLLMGGLKKYQSIRVEKVAQAMLNQGLKDMPGVFIHPSDELQQSFSDVI